MRASDPHPTDGVRLEQRHEAVVVVLLNAARVALPLLVRIDWQHERAAEAASLILIYTGIPVLFALTLLGLLLLPSLRPLRTAPRPTARRRLARSR